MSDNVDKTGWIEMTVEDTAISGICHARGSNAEQPGGWAGGQFCVIEDPSGATAALYQP